MGALHALLSTTARLCPCLPTRPAKPEPKGILRPSEPEVSSKRTRSRSVSRTRLKKARKPAQQQQQPPRRVSFAPTPPRPIRLLVEHAGATGAALEVGAATWGGAQFEDPRGLTPHERSPGGGRAARSQASGRARESAAPERRPRESVPTRRPQQGTNPERRARESTASRQTRATDQPDTRRSSRASSPGRRSQAPRSSTVPLQDSQRLPRDRTTQSTTRRRTEDGREPAPQTRSTARRRIEDRRTSLYGTPFLETTTHDDPSPGVGADNARFRGPASALPSISLGRSARFSPREQAAYVLRYVDDLGKGTDVRAVLVTVSQYGYERFYASS